MSRRPGMRNSWRANYVVNIRLSRHLFYVDTRPFFLITDVGLGTNFTIIFLTE